ncbi:hypothetical protein [Ulvibacterium sp.]|uniref:hypothetical protein n=1 Tax=Ulvibacterium sp. TaxID=2665914 RepID=UPI0026260FCD|nr:hypothetical protein [Ulvibacterium sp.]
MKLPTNGRIVLVDNRYEEISPIVDFLSRNRIPYNYFSGEMDKLPDNPTNSVRIIFLDLQITEGSNPKLAISTVASILKRIVVVNPSPYIIVAWSKHASEDDYTSPLEELFKKGKILEKIAPVKILYLSKSDYMHFDTDIDKWVLDEGGDIKLASDIPEKLSRQSVLLNFMQYENIVHDATGELINYISSYNFDSNWNAETKTILYQLAKAIIGEEEIQSSSASQRLEKALLLSNNILHEEIENLIKIRGLGDIDSITKGKVDQNAVIRLNTKIHLSKENSKSSILEQGNLFINKRKRTIVKQIIDQYVVIGRANELKQAYIKEILDDKPWELMLDITPVCDYAQSKDYMRFIYGVALPKKHEEKIKSPGPVFLYSEKVVFEIEGQFRFFIFDFRKILSIPISKFKKQGLSPNYKLRREIVTDIQAQLSNQINRPGIGKVS